MKRPFLASIAAVAATFGIAIATARAAPTPSSVFSSATPPPVTATATPTPSGTLLRYSGMLLDVERGYAFFTSGDGFALDPHVRIVDAATGGPTTLVPATRVYARAAFDATTGKIVELGLSRSPLPDAGDYAAVARFAVAQSPRTANPDLDRPGIALTGKLVPVAFVVEVPPSTPIADTVYIGTDASNWNPRAIRMDRIDALHYRAVVRFPSGTHLQYRYTRGSWQTVERGPTGLEMPPRAFVVAEIDVMRRQDVVAHWADEGGAGGTVGPDATPTPFMALPFATPPR